MIWLIAMGEKRLKHNPSLLRQNVSLQLILRQPCREESVNVTPWRIQLGLLLLIVAAVVAGCNGPTSNTRQEPLAPANAKAEDYPLLASPLFTLATASQVQEKAGQLGLDYLDGLVLVVVELETGESADDVRWAIEALQGQIELVQDTSIQARVPPRTLLLLAKHPRVAYIRAPAKAKFD